MHVKLKSCRHAGKIVADLGQTPLADAFPDTVEQAADQLAYPLEVALCYACGMLELTEFVDDKLLFGDDYAFYSGTSPALVRHFERYAHWIQEQFGDELDRGVVEIACNDGTLLRHFKDFPHVGVDPAEPAERAIKDGLNVVRAPFTAEAAQVMAHELARLRPDRATEAGVVIANNVVAHVADFQGFLAGVATLIGYSGAAIFEFQYLPDLLLGNQFDLIYHEHRRFLSLKTLEWHARSHGMHLVDALPVDTQGGSMRVVLMHQDAGRSTPRLDALVERETRYLTRHAVESFAERIATLTELLHDAVAAEVAAGRTVALYGAPAKATTLLRGADLTHEQLAYAVDLTPHKVGRYMPGTQIPVISPDREGLDVRQADVYLLAISNYLGSVIRREHEFLSEGGRFIVPLPKPVII